MKTELEKLRAKADELDTEISELRPLQVRQTNLIPKVIRLCEQRSECLKAIGTLTVGRMRVV